MSGCQTVIALSGRVQRPSRATTLVDEIATGIDDLVQSNFGFRSNLVGTPRQILERIVAPKNAGTDLVLLAVLQAQEEVEHFGRTIIPLVRERELERGGYAVVAD